MSYAAILLSILKFLMKIDPVHPEITGPIRGELKNKIREETAAECIARSADSLNGPEISIYTVIRTI